MHTQLEELPGRMRALVLQLVPGSAPVGQKVAASRTGSPTGARLDALTLVGPGADGLSDAAVAAMMHPAVRRWRTTTTVTVQMDTPDGPVDRDVDIVRWEQQPLFDTAGQPVMVAADDQVGILPPAEWLDSWARTWRRHFGNHTRPAPRREHATRRPDGDAGRQYAIQVVLGLLPGHNGAATVRPDDPVAEEWDIRWGDPQPDLGVAEDATYLAARLDAACEQDVGIADFAAELRAVTAELTRVLGEKPDVTWLGRCPAQVTDWVTERSRRCGAGLWQDPQEGQVVCPRCRSAWGPGKTALLHLAQQIRRVWPVDRRRRYAAAEIDALTRRRRPLRCPACAEPATITWRDVTAIGDRQRYWRPDRATCPAGCPDAGRLI